ncbi:hypothetical protein RradSPS_0853 [Rubrobacter radiotolerans]|uniref:ATP-dependent Clp protease adaptor ClpS n=1 Tax=Rubrobacter radiotolerans TaxID=42256 RepID=A0A023X1S0_RUBRA|nr:ATP-dependent Clp protease adaptor ClpS [Rubrobacter radiotolerans]AHY46136.1 hypothetical protein RradSPS_0853 [Rubrobacter radiotolerans]MDX5893546.1 ATP-dependent Clp protease adaptor ClpS [Rubrobacter radiotolerans]SMC03957.1 ATP-dependent Clp protease adaptor protein ClpS [Rubrobacter radiotolerans DSM 5868]
MAATKRGPARESAPATQRKNRTEPPYNVLLHNDWSNSMTRVVLVLRRVVPGMTFARATGIMLEAHTRGKSVVKSCHRELAELYEERLEAEGLTASVERA